MLYLDKEGGYGGSSRSLFFLIAHLDRSVFEPLVVSREVGPIARKYASIQVDHRVENIPVLKAGQRKNLLMLGLFLFRLPRWLAAMLRLGRMMKRNGVSLIHLNHDSFFPVAIWNRFFWRRPVVCHIRTMIPKNWFGRWQVRSLARNCQKLICISERERDRVLELIPDSVAAKRFVHVIHNIGELPDGVGGESDIGPPTEWRHKFKVIWLGNVSHGKGTDRVLDVARVLKAQRRTDIAFLVCGEERSPSRPPLMEELAVVIERAGLMDTVRLMGFVESPKSLLQASHVVLRTSRTDDPWGRDIIEGLVHGKPILATGVSSPVMEDGVHGFLFPEFSPAAVAHALRRLADDTCLYDEMSRRNREHGEKLFSGAAVARGVASVYGQLIGGAA